MSGPSPGLDKSVLTLPIHGRGINQHIILRRKGLHKTNQNMENGSMMCFKLWEIIQKNSLIKRWPIICISM